MPVPGHGGKVSSAQHSYRNRSIEPEVPTVLLAESLFGECTLPVTIGRCSGTVLESSPRRCGDAGVALRVRLVGLAFPHPRGCRCAQTGSRDSEDRRDVVRPMNLPAGYMFVSRQLDREISRSSRAATSGVRRRTAGRGGFPPARGCDRPHPQSWCVRLDQ